MSPYLGHYAHLPFVLCSPHSVLHNFYVRCYVSIFFASGAMVYYQQMKIIFAVSSELFLSLPPRVFRFRLSVGKNSFFTLSVSIFHRRSRHSIHVQNRSLKWSSFLCDSTSSLTFSDIYSPPIIIRHFCRSKIPRIE